VQYQRQRVVLPAEDQPQPGVAGPHAQGVGRAARVVENLVEAQ